MCVGPLPKDMNGNPEGIENPGNADSTTLKAQCGSGERGAVARSPCRWITVVD